MLVGMFVLDFVAGEWGPAVAVSACTKYMFLGFCGEWRPAVNGSLLLDLVLTYLLWLLFFLCLHTAVWSVCPLLPQAATLLRLSETMAARDIRHTLVQLVSVWRGDTVKALDQ